MPTQPTDWAAPPPDKTRRKADTPPVAEGLRCETAMIVDGAAVPCIGRRGHEDPHTFDPINALSFQAPGAGVLERRGRRDSGLAAALLEAQSSIVAIPKDSRAELRKEGKLLYAYDFAAGDDVIAAARAALHASGLSIGPDEGEPWAIRPPEHGQRCATLVAFLRLDHPASGEFRRYAPTMPIASRNDDDKAMAGTLTYLLSNFYRLLLSIPRTAAEPGDDPDKRTEPARGPGRDDDDRNGHRNASRHTTRTPTGAANDPDADAARLRALLKSRWALYVALHQRVYPDAEAPLFSEFVGTVLERNGEPAPWPMQPTAADREAALAKLAERSAELDRIASAFDFGEPSP